LAFIQIRKLTARRFLAYARHLMFGSWSFPGALSLELGASRLLVALLLLSAFVARAFVATTPLELHEAADLDGDGRPDMIVVDRQSGAIRVAYQFAPGNYAWFGPHGGGVTNASGLSVGAVLTPGQRALALTSPEANRVNLFDLSNPAATPVPVSAFSGGLGPNAVVAVDVGGAGNTAHADLASFSQWNSGTPDRISLLRSHGTNFFDLTTNSLSGPAASANRVLLKAGHTNLVAAIARNGATDVFAAVWTGSGATVAQISQPGLPVDSTYVFAPFNPALPLAQFLFYVPAASNLVLRAVQEPVPLTFAFGAPASFNLGVAIRAVVTLPDTNSVKLLVLLEPPVKQRVYTFDGSNAPVFVQEISADPGETFTGAFPTGGGSFQSLGSRDGSGRTTDSRPMNWNGATYTAGPRTTLPALASANVAGNVLLFRAEPMVNDNPGLLKTLSAADWSSGVAFTGAPPVVAARKERFLGPTNGLGGAVTNALGNAPPLTGYALANQYSNQISIFSFSPAVGDAPAEVSISPAPGAYATAISVSFSASTNASVFYRFNHGGSWSNYTAPFTVFSNTTVNYYARSLTGSNSSIRSAAYTFDTGTTKIDSDRDGVPDFVEASEGLDPTKGPDSDGDGYSDLDELLAGSDPNLRTDTPTNHIASYTRLDLQGSFDVIATPLPYDGGAGRHTIAATGTVLRAYQIPGALLAYAGATNITNASLVSTSAPLRAVSIDTRHPLLVVGTEEHFNISTTNADTKIGRELVGLIPTPAPPPFDVGYTAGTNTLSVEASNWIAAAQSAAATNSRVTVAVNLAPTNTLTALLLEKKLAEILLARGTNAATNLTLFPYRAPDTGRVPAPLTALTGLLSIASVSLPGYRLEHVFSNLNTRVTGDPDPDIASLRDVAVEIYRISSASNSAVPGVYPSPVNTLRDFLATGALHSNYAAIASGAISYSGAFAAVSNLLAAVPSRPTTNIVLRVRGDSFNYTDTTVLETTDFVPSPRYLFTTGGRRFDFPQAFLLATGSLVQVYGYTDVTNRHYPSNNLEVITAGVQFITVASDPDADGNLLVDSWERAFQLNNPWADADGDGYQNIQEMFDGSDPRDSFGIPTAGIGAFAAPTLTIVPDGAVIRLRFNWPAAYVSKVLFQVKSTPALGLPFAVVPTPAPASLGGDLFELAVPAPMTTAHFYLVTLSLR
jgi:hypothetical protein